MSKPMIGFGRKLCNSEWDLGNSATELEQPLYGEPAGSLECVSWGDGAAVAGRAMSLL